MKNRFNLLCLSLILACSACSKQPYYFSNQPIGAYHNTNIPKPDSTQIALKEPKLEATLEISPAIENTPVYVSEKYSAAQSIKNLYSSETKDLKAFKREYKRSKANYREENNFVKKVTKKSGEGNGAIGITSFVLAVVGLLVSGAAHGVLAIMLGTFALIFGIVGSSRNKKGYAILGILLGIVDILVGMSVLAAVM